MTFEGWSTRGTAAEVMAHCGLLLAITNVGIDNDVTEVELFALVREAEGVFESSCDERSGQKTSMIQLRNHLTRFHARKSNDFKEVETNSRQPTCLSGA